MTTQHSSTGDRGIGSSTFQGSRTAITHVRARATRLARLHVTATQAHLALLRELAQFADDEMWKDDGSTDMVSWMTFELGLLPRTARAWLAVAEVIDELPVLRERFATGAISFDQLVALCKIATPEDEANLALLAETMTAAEIERMVRQTREVPRKVLVDEELERTVSWFWDTDDRFLHLKGKIPGIDGVAFERAMLRTMSQEEPDPVTGIRPFPERAADALVALASAGLAADGDADRATVVVHVSADALAGRSEAPGVTADGRVTAIEDVRRRACDARWQPVVDGSDGSPVGIGRTSRRIPAWLLRQIQKRDKGCRFPGCGRTRWLQIHHRVHWADGGPTDIINLVSVCGFHHRKIHNEGWTIEGDANGTLTWISPHGWKHDPIRKVVADTTLWDFHVAGVEERYAELVGADP